MVGLVEEKVKNSFVAPCRDALRSACFTLYICMLCQGKPWTAWGQYVYTKMWYLIPTHDHSFQWVLLCRVVLYILLVLWNKAMMHILHSHRLVACVQDNNEVAKRPQEMMRNDRKSLL